ncbi:pyruvate dehydrogenase complex dihydrolipoyllysine-residue acetyltransferase [Sphingomonas oligophenolica]|uniref:Dihydrolipoamide acetyltransferase component of pyruvate dehydrogenase complex n=1 Tax=Sphingomonas oligophenolica TaxID=301154 RepID=A0ABU9Y162_9SPHN
MATFNMPSLGADMEAGILVEWLKQPGDEVHRGDIVAVVETDKGAIEVEIFEDGRIGKLLVAQGTKVPVGTPLATVATAGEAVAEPAATAEPSPAPTPVPIAQPMPVTPLAVHVGVRASPAARKLAAELGLDLATVDGGGPQGAIIRADVVRAGERKGPAPRHGLDLSQMRRAIAAAMARSKREIPHYYLAHSFEVTAAQQALARYNAERAPADRLLFGTYLVKAVALAMRDFPEFNGFHGEDGFKPSTAIHVGVAIAIRGGGLAAPAIHDTDRLTVAELMVKMRDLVGRVRRGGFRSSEIADATVTVSSLGERGIETMFPIIYPPQVAILGFGAVLPRPWPVGEEVAVRPVLSATLSADHRASDGHRGALLLERIEELLARPEAL